MSVAFVTNASIDAIVTNATVNITVSGTNPVLVVNVGLNSATATVLSVTWDLGSGTPVEHKTVRGGTVYASAWNIPAPSLGAGTVTSALSTVVAVHADVDLYSGAHQTTPCPSADAVTSVAVTTSETVSALNLVTGDMANGMSTSTGSSPNGVTPTQRYILDNSSIALQTGDTTNTNGSVTFADFTAVGTRAKIVSRIVQAPTSVEVTRSGSEGLYFVDAKTVEAFVASQSANPNADIFDGQWLASDGSGNLYTMIDEDVADDADFIYTNTLALCSLGLETLTDPGVDTGHFVRYRARGDGVQSLRTRLWCNSYNIATWVTSGMPLGMTTYVQSLTTTEANSITDYAALRLSFEMF